MDREDRDLFAIPARQQMQARARTTDPETSHAAASSIDPQAGKIRTQVEAFAYGKGEGGFIDEDLSKAFGAESVSSYRTRRAELTDLGKVLDSGQRRSNSGGRECIVWVHADRAGEITAPPRKPITKCDPSSVEESLRLLAACVAQMKAEGWMAARTAEEALATIRRACR